MPNMKSRLLGSQTAEINREVRIYHTVAYGIKTSTKILNMQ